jgi:ubiquitin carboxyl-terminal hydrolase 8
MNGACRFGAKCTSQPAEEGKDIQDGSDFISNNVSTSEIRKQAKESISNEARGLSALTLIRTARTQILSAQEQEGKGDLALAYASYIKAATLIKLTMDSPEHVQNANLDTSTAIRAELAEFLQVCHSFWAC